MARFDIQKSELYLIDLPVQPVTQFGENGKPFTVDGTEMHGPHPCYVVSVESDGSSAVVVPLTSAQNERGGEKWQTWKKSWARVNHDGKYAAALCEQVRYVCRGRFLRKCESVLGEYDSGLIESKLRSVLGL